MKNEIQVSGFLILFCERKGIDLQKILADGLCNPNVESSEGSKNFAPEVTQPVVK